MTSCRTLLAAENLKCDGFSFDFEILQFLLFFDLSGKMGLPFFLAFRAVVYSGVSIEGILRRMVGRLRPFPIRLRRVMRIEPS